MLSFFFIFDPKLFLCDTVAIIKNVSPDDQNYLQVFIFYCLSNHYKKFLLQIM